MFADSKSYGNLGSIAAARATFLGWMKAFNDRDIDALMSYYDVNIVVRPATSSQVVGIEAVRAWLRSLLPSLTGTTMLYKEDFAFGGEDLAVLIGTFLFESSNGPGPAGRVALTYRRDGRGEWKLVFDVDNNPPDASLELFR